MQKLTGVQKIQTFFSSKVFRTTSQPIPFKSPIETPSFIFVYSSAMLLIRFMLKFTTAKLGI